MKRPSGCSGSLKCTGRISTDNFKFCTNFMEKIFNIISNLTIEFPVPLYGVFSCSFKEGQAILESDITYLKFLETFFIMLTCHLRFRE